MNLVSINYVLHECNHGGLDQTGKNVSTSTIVFECGFLSAKSMYLQHLTIEGGG